MHLCEGYTVFGTRNRLKAAFLMQSPGPEKPGKLHAPSLHLQSSSADALGEVRAKDTEQAPGCGQAQQMTHLELREETGIVFFMVLLEKLIQIGFHPSTPMG